jgi:hypothetical protein
VTETERELADLLEAMNELLLESFTELTRLREAVLADDQARERYSVGFGQQRFLEKEQACRELLERVREWKLRTDRH